MTDPMCGTTEGGFGALGTPQRTKIVAHLGWLEEFLNSSDRCSAAVGGELPWFGSPSGTALAKQALLRAATAPISHTAVLRVMALTRTITVHVVTLEMSCWPSDRRVGWPQAVHLEA